MNETIQLLTPEGKPKRLRDVEKEVIMRSLQRNDWSRVKVAKELAIGVRTLYDKLVQYRTLEKMNGSSS